MSITLDFDIQQLDNKRPMQLHYLPAKIVGDGECTDVDKHFNNYTRDTPEFGKGILSNALRGYPLLGKRESVPKGYKGLVLQETDENQADRQLRLTGTFQDFTYWNYDKVPSKGDGYQQALVMLEVAEALAAPISEDALENEMKLQQQAKKENA
ncbi:uncharacterized protein LOC132791517 [Drosophila nasuta]|uniref:Uncharacterized protein LOC117567158 n=1 Tax=Drosophila albomicans TaxID=7291 RepID=A0A6P8Y175_DROAB|nr:uncharacterized protein LOC117567158 [Drosophila albomicans]XP_060656458.1 uncharacterized protein LOC132791517 [Drosophila nasuta]